MKRFCQTLTLRDDPELIAAYAREHRHVWPEIQAGIRAVGILDMQIYLHGNLLFMIVDTVDDFDWQADNARLARLPRQAEWEAWMSRFQNADPGAGASEKWQLMEKIFELSGEG
jgi:L-rhamnose mutarotase